MEWKIINLLGNIWESIVNLLTMKQWIVLLLTVGLLAAVLIPVIL